MSGSSLREPRPKWSSAVVVASWAAWSRLRCNTRGAASRGGGPDWAQAPAAGNEGISVVLMARSQARQASSNTSQALGAPAYDCCMTPTVKVSPLWYSSDP